MNVAELSGWRVSVAVNLNAAVFSSIVIAKQFLLFIIHLQTPAPSERYAMRSLA